MALPDIGQAEMVTDQLKFAVEKNRPESLALIGCAGGNGLQAIVGGPVRRVVGIDINPKYVEIAHSRFHKYFPTFEVYVGNIESLDTMIEPVDLAFAALIFEFVDVACAFKTIKNICRPKGRFIILLQTPNASMPAVSISPYTSLKALTPVVRLRNPEDIIRASEDVGFKCLGSDEIALASGKKFSVVTMGL
jgi:SAM-dependent methyltransferase